MATPFLQPSGSIAKAGVLVVALVVAVATVGVESASRIDKPTKKYCKTHKKNCRRNIKGRGSRGGVVFNRGNWSKGIDQDWHASTNQPNEPGAWLHRVNGAGTECTGTPDNNGYWCLNGGPKARKGCRNITGYSRRLGRVFDNDLYQLNLHAHWCFGKRRVKDNRQLWANSYVSRMHWSADDQGYVDGAQATEFYRYSKRPHGGHFWQRQKHIKMCIAWGVGCIYNRYPWVRIYGHGNGTWHASGNTG
jgi:hypothetical protein